MITILAMVCGAFTSAAWVAPRPYCYSLGVVSFVLFVMIRRLQ